jgi:hypothetical protein
MNPRTEKQETYREQLPRLAHCLCAGRSADVVDDLAPGSTPARLKLFGDRNTQERIESLLRQLDFVSPAFAGLDELAGSFVRSLPPAWCENPAHDGERFLDWLEETQQPQAAQRDYIGCQRARFAVEEAARQNRLGHVRFQDLLSLAGSLADELETNRSLELCLNPIRAWSRLETSELPGHAASLPATVVLYPVGDEIRTLVLDTEGLARVRELAAFGPVTLDAWQNLLEPFAGLREISRRELASLCRELVRLGLVALA